MTRHPALRPTPSPLLASAALSLAAAAGHAQTLAFDNSCGTNLWHGSCATVVSFDPVVCHCYNNWDNGLGTSDNCHACPSEPGAADNVFIGNIYVDADYTNPIRSLTTTSLFRNSYVISVSFAAFYGGPVVGRGSFAGAGTHTFASSLTPDTNATMEMLWPCTVELNGPLNINPGAGFGVYTEVRNNATTTWSSNVFSIDGAYGGGTNAVFRNRPGALFLHTTDGEIRGVIGLGHFENAGTFRKDGGLGTTAIASEFKNLAGALIDVRTGSLAITGESTLAGAAAVAAGATLAISNLAHVPNQFTVNGPGTLRVNNGLIVDAGAAANVTNLDTGLNSENYVGTLRGPGTLNVSGSANLAGTLTDGLTLSLAHGCAAAMNSTLSFDGVNTNLNNHGVLTWTGGHFQLGETTSLNNMPGGVLDCRVQANAGGYFFTTGGMTNAGLVRKTAGGRTSFSLPFVNSGVISCEFDRLGFARFRQTAGQTILAGGELDGDFQVEPLRFEGGTLRGSGNIRGPVINTGAVVAPGSSPGAISISGGAYGNAYTQGPGGTLRIELGGTTPTTFDRLAVDGPITLDGALEVTLINGFTPQVGQTFNIITCTSRSGQFATVSLPPGLQLVYSSNSVALMLAGPSGCSIADRGSLGGNPAPDGVLTADDVVAFLSAFFANNITVADVASLGGGPIPDGQVTVDDLVAFLAAFFSGCP